MGAAPQASGERTGCVLALPSVRLASYMVEGH